MPEDRFSGVGDYHGMDTPHRPPAFAHARTVAQGDEVTQDSRGRDVPTASGDDVSSSAGTGRDIVAAVIYYSGVRALFRDDEAALAAAGVLQPRLGKYTLDRVLGSGGKGAVLLGRNPDLDEEVAIKVLRPDARGDHDREGARLLREGRTLARLVHPNIVPIHDAGLEGGLQYIVMRRVRGATLRAAQVDASWQQIVDLYLQAGRGLAAVHAAGLAHRDFKADNVLVEDDGRVMLADFGLVCVLSEPAPAPRTPHPGVFAEAITRTGEVHGTPAYMAPEAFCGAPATVASDLFSFASSLFEALYRERPFGGDGYAELVFAVLEGRVVARPAVTDVPEWLDAAVRRSLRPEPGQRHATLSELLADIDFHARDRAAAEQLARTTRRRRLSIAAVTAAVSGVLLGGIVGSYQDPCADPQTRLADAWGEPLRARVGALGDPGARLVGLLDGHADAWTATFTGICTATHVDGTQSPELHDARMTCLDQRRRELAAVAAPLADSDDPAAVDAALLAAARLDSPRPCARAERVPRPRPEQAPAVAALADTLASVRVHELAGDYPAAAQLADSLVERARIVEFEPILAEALVARGRVYRQTDEWTAARDDLSAALDLAERHALDTLAIDAASQLTKLAAIGLRESALAHEWARQAERKLDRTHGDDGSRAELVNNRGLIAYRLDVDYPQARTLHEDALRLREGLQASGVESRLRVAESHYNLGNVLCALGDITGGVASYRESRRLHVEVLGLDHPTIGELLRDEAAELRRLGDLEAAALLADEAVEILARKPAAATALARAHRLVSALGADLGDLVTAERHARQALALMSNHGSPHARDLAEVHSGLAYVLQRRGAAAEAHREYDAGLAALAATEAHPDVRVGLLFNRGELQVELGHTEAALVDFAAAQKLIDSGNPELAGYRPYILKGIGAAHLAAGHPEAAISPLSDALARMPAEVDPQLRAAIEDNLARALPPGERAEARRLAESAAAAFERLHDDDSLAAVRRWLADFP